MNVAIIGYGFVGKALKAGLKDDVITKEIDPILKTSTKDLETFNPKIIFICVPTPMGDNGKQDCTILETVIDEIVSLNIQSTIVIKSSVLPDTLTKIRKRVPGLIYNPEFLREKFAKEDFINSELIIFGGKKRSCKILADFYKNHTRCIHKRYIFTDLVTASLVKFTINSFLATKVIFFNQIKDLYVNSDAKDDWDNFTKFLAVDKRIGHSHMSVPGHDGKLGFGGACLPKDSNAIYEYGIEIGVNLDLIKKIIILNNSIRKKYDSDDREKIQNISYD